MNIRELWVNEEENKALAFMGNQIAVWQPEQMSILDWLKDSASMKFIPLEDLNYSYIDVSPNFLMFLVTTHSLQQAILSIPLEQFFCFNPESEKLSEKLTLALDLGQSEAQSFSFDEEKSALYINFQGIAIARKSLLDQEPNNSVDTVFSVEALQDESFRIVTFNVFSSQHQQETSLLTLQLENETMTVLQLLKLNHVERTVMTIGLEISQLQIERNQCISCFIGVQQQIEQLIAVNNSKGVALIFKIDFDTLQVLSTSIISLTQHCIPLLIKSKDGLFTRTPCIINYQQEINQSTHESQNSTPRPIEIPIIHPIPLEQKPSQGNSSITSLKERRAARKTMSMTANFEEFLKLRDLKNHSRSTSWFQGAENINALAVLQRQTSATPETLQLLDKPINKTGEVGFHHRNKKSMNMGVKELQQQTNMMSEKIKNAQARRFMRAKEDQQKITRELQKEKEKLTFSKLKRLVAIIQRISLKTGFTQLLSNSQNSQNINKQLKQLVAIAKQNSLKQLLEGFIKIKNIADQRKMIEDYKREVQNQVLFERTSHKIMTAFSKLDKKIVLINLMKGFSQIKSFSYYQKQQLAFKQIGLKIMERVASNINRNNIIISFTRVKEAANQTTIMGLKHQISKLMSQIQPQIRYKQLSDQIEEKCHAIRLTDRVIFSHKIIIPNKEKQIHRQRSNVLTNQNDNLIEVIELNDFEEEEQTLIQDQQLTDQALFHRQGYHRPSQLSLSQIVAKTQDEEKDHQTLDDEEDQAIFQRLFEKYHQELHSSSNTKQQQHYPIQLHTRSQSNAVKQQIQVLSTGGLLSPSSLSHKDLNMPQDFENNMRLMPQQVYEYILEQTNNNDFASHVRRMSSTDEGVNHYALPVPFILPDIMKSESISICDERPNDIENRIPKVEKDYFDNDQFIRCDNETEKKDFSFSIDQERGGVVINGGGIATGTMSISSVSTPFPVQSKTSTRKHSIIQSRNHKQDPGLMMISSKQQREMAAMNELNEILNERLSIGVSQRDIERKEKINDEHAGYYETLGSHRIAPMAATVVGGFNPQLEQETANFNREDWFGTQFRSASSRSNNHNHVRAETKVSLNSRLSTVHQANIDQRCTPFLGEQNHTSTQFIHETTELDAVKIPSQQTRSPETFSPPKVQYDPNSILALQEYYKGNTSHLQDNTQAICESQSPLGLMHHSHYANFSQDFISPDDQSKKSVRNIVVSGTKTIHISNTPQSLRKGGILDTSGATTPAQQSAFEMFRIRLHTNLQNLRSQSHSRAIDSMDQKDEKNTNSLDFNPNKHSRSHSHSITISEHQQEGFHSKRISLNQFGAGAVGMGSGMISTAVKQLELKKLQHSPIKTINNNDEVSRELMGLISNSVFQGIANADNEMIGGPQYCEEVSGPGCAAESEQNNTMRYVEPFTQRASLANLELAEPMEIGGVQSSFNESEYSANLKEMATTEERNSPLKTKQKESPKGKRLQTEEQEMIRIDMVGSFAPPIIIEEDRSKLMSMKSEITQMNFLNFASAGGTTSEVVTPSTKKSYINFFQPTTKSKFNSQHQSPMNVYQQNTHNFKAIRPQQSWATPQQQTMQSDQTVVDQQPIRIESLFMPKQQIHGNDVNSRNIQHNFQNSNTVPSQSNKLFEAFTNYEAQKTIGDGNRQIPNEVVDQSSKRDVIQEQFKLYPSASSKKAMSMDQFYSTSDTLQMLQLPSQGKHLKFQSMFGNFSKTTNIKKDTDQTSSRSSVMARCKRSDMSGSTFIQKGSITFGQNQIEGGGPVGSFHSNGGAARHNALISIITPSDMIHEQSDEMDGSITVEEVKNINNEQKKLRERDEATSQPKSPVSVAVLEKPKQLKASNSRNPAQPKLLRQTQSYEIRKQTKKAEVAHKQAAKEIFIAVKSTQIKPDQGDLNSMPSGSTTTKVSVLEPNEELKQQDQSPLNRQQTNNKSPMHTEVSNEKVNPHNFNKSGQQISVLRYELKSSNSGQLKLNKDNARSNLEASRNNSMNKCAKNSLTQTRKSLGEARGSLGPRSRKLMINNI